MKTLDEDRELAIKLINSGKIALLDEIIETHIKPLFFSLDIASVKYFTQKGDISGGFLLALRKMLIEYGEICDKSLTT